MFEALVAVFGIVALFGVFLIAGRLLAKRQATDRRYGGSGDSGAGITGRGDPGPLS
jgi:hypothetical protein